MSMMTVKDLEKLQDTLNQAGLDYQLELEDGKILVVGLSDEESVLGNEDILTVPELFPGWEVPISELWPPVFDEEE